MIFLMEITKEPKIKKEEKKEALFTHTAHKYAWKCEVPDCVYCWEEKK